MSQTHFGFQNVDERDKARRVPSVFDSVAPRYDLMNDLMSMGLHRAWKPFTVLAADRRATPQAPRGLRIERESRHHESQHRDPELHFASRTRNARVST